jgi:Tfp pilus assembly protein PilF
VSAPATVAPDTTARAADAVAGPAPAAAPPAWIRRAPLLAALLGALVYAPSLGGGFLYDDLHVVVGNRHIRDLRALGSVLGYEPARPLLGLVWALNYAAGGQEPWSYHVVNMLFHIVNAALVASLFLWMARRRGLGPEPAALGAALFAVTPMAAETVAYVSSRSTALCALFMLASLRLAGDALVQASRTRAAGALACALLGLATKEEAAALPLLLLLLERFFVAGEPSAGARFRAGLHAAFWALPLLGLAARAVVTGALLPGGAVPAGTYLLTQLAAFPLYFLRALVPLDPALYREHPVAPWPPDASTLAGLAGTAALVTAALAGRRRWPLWSFAIGWLSAALLPSSSLVALNEMVVDHRAYLGGAGVLFAGAGVLWRLGGWRLAAVVLALLAARAVHYEWVLADPVRAWTDAARRTPRSPAVRLNLSEAYLAAGDPRAEPELWAAVSLAPSDPRPWTNLGALYLQQGRIEDAEGAMRRAAALTPGDARIRNNLATILRAQGRDAEAIAELEAAVAADPRLAQPRIELAELLLRHGRPEEARAQLQQAMRLEIDEEDARAIQAVRERLR